MRVLVLKGVQVENGSRCTGGQVLSEPLVPETHQMVNSDEGLEGDDPVSTD